MDPNAERKTWMSLLARAPAQLLADLWAKMGDEPEFEWLRAPEIGGAMVRGRMGGTGAAFNLGEMTVTRCSLRLADGAVGHAYVQGRDKPKAQIAALVDALMQGPEARRIRHAILDPLGDKTEAKRTARAAKAAATKVEFFTMMRGED
ncbi:phosphonate C-P lyase system protein PhnG [Thalassovita sp.]|uniref:phosphonate C-P lyase system protein PhnG n=1 Tax=Thalassovita sp. TaxID=1979401 RepID=UPI002881A053|nr:phosphonate C-P lyase system protein PhnG [Thalassovita sp.]MDF1802024.1 phosphonate C-P lyase system protein PhnG [Thalassovita sp.]